MSQQKKQKIQKELEELSWAFLAESKEPEEENLEFLIEENEETDELDNTNNSDDYIDDDIKSLYAKNNYDYNLNDMGRNAGIIMDEDKLEAHKVTEWHKPKKNKESKVKVFLKQLWQLITWPVRIIVLLINIFIKNIYLALHMVFINLFKLIKTVFILSWQFIVAFKYVWIYLFGEINWFRKRELKPVVVSVYSSKQSIIWKRTLSFVVLAIFLVLPLQIYSTYYRAKNIKGEVLGVAESGLAHLQEAGKAGSALNFNEASHKFTLAEENFSVIKNKVDELGIVANKLGEFIPDVKTGKRLIEVAELSSQVGRHIVESASWLNEMPVGLNMAMAMDKSENDNKEINLIQANYEIKLALAKTEKINNILNDIKLEGTTFVKYKKEFEELRNNLPNLISWLREGNKIISVLNYVLGMDEPRRLMLVFQNNTELRPSGGFMGSYAIVDVKNAKIKNIIVPGGGFYDLKGSLAVKVDAPYPFHLFSPIWQPWNANWFYDWPTSAQKIEWFYDKSGGSSVDGVIAFTPKVIVELLKVVGEIDMPEYNLVVNSDNFIREAQLQVEFGYDKEENKPKKFIGDLMPKILDKLAKVNKNQLVDILQIILENFKEKHLLVYLNDKDFQMKIKELGWAGEVKNNNGDYLAVVHTNVAGGKTDGVIDEKINHQAEILADGSIIDTLILTKNHRGRADDVFEGQVNVDYVRFYVPLGSKLLSAQGFDAMPTGRIFQEDKNVVSDSLLKKVEKNLRIDKQSQTRITDEFDKTVFANWLTVAPGESKKVTIKYLLPIKYKSADENNSLNKNNENIWQLLKRYFLGSKNNEIKNEQNNYSLLIQKQPGINGNNVNVESNLKLNKYWQIINYQDKNNTVLWENGVKFKDNLKTDDYYKVIFEKR